VLDEPFLILFALLAHTRLHSDNLTGSCRMVSK
jgi:hypothetical protein